jgi:hypothetical protein
VLAPELIRRIALLAVRHPIAAIRRKGTKGTRMRSRGSPVKTEAAWASYTQVVTPQ